MNIQQLATLFALLSDSAYAMRSVVALSAKTGLSHDTIDEILTTNGIAFNTRTRRSDGAEMIEVLRD